MQQSKQFVNGRFENTPPYVSNMSLQCELHDYMGDQVREPAFEVPVLSERQLHLQHLRRHAGVIGVGDQRADPGRTTT